MLQILSPSWKYKSISTDVTFKIKVCYNYIVVVLINLMINNYLNNSLVL